MTNNYYFYEESFNHDDNNIFNSSFSNEGGGFWLNGNFPYNRMNLDSYSFEDLFKLPNQSSKENLSTTQNNNLQEKDETFKNCNINNINCNINNYNYDNNNKPCKKFKIKQCNKGRKNDIDNYSHKLFMELNNWYLKLLQNIIDFNKSKIKNENKDLDLPSFKLSPPDHYVFTSNTNYTDIRFFLDIPFKYILIMNKRTKEVIDKLLIHKKIKKLRFMDNQLDDDEYKYGRIFVDKILNEKEFGSKFIKDPNALRDYINCIIKKIKPLEEEEVQEITKEEVKTFLIQFLKLTNNKFKNDDKLYKYDREHINQIFEESKIKISYELQSKNKKIIEATEKIKEIGQLYNKTLRQIIMEFYRSGTEFDKFYQKAKNIDDYFFSTQSEENNKFHLSEIYGNTCGFIKHIENKNKKKSKDIQDLIEDLNKNHIQLNEKELQNYIDKNT